MTMTDQNPPAAPKPKPKRTWRRKAPAAAAKPASEFEGLTRQSCCDACNEKHCVISGINVCGHPHKGAAQPGLQMDPKAVGRRARASAFLKT